MSILWEVIDRQSREKIFYGIIFLTAGLSAFTLKMAMESAGVENPPKP
jgi:hypothetical protein